jgi:hypothetical protein
MPICQSSSPQVYNCQLAHWPLPTHLPACWHKGRWPTNPQATATHLPAYQLLGDLQQTKQNTFLLEPHLVKKKKRKKKQIPKP